MVERCCEVVRSSAKTQGCKERTVFVVTPDFKWRKFEDALMETSLFSTKKLIEIRLPQSGKLGKAGSNSVRACLRSPNKDTIVMMIGGTFEKKVKKVKWFEDWSKSTVVVDNPGFQPAEFRKWIQSQLDRNKIQYQAAVVDRLAYYFEGNMIAAANELRKLKMAYQGKQITVDEINKIVIDQARFNIFALIEACLEGNVERSIRLVRVMKNEGSEPGFVLWALAREARIIYQIAQIISRGLSTRKIFEDLRIWQVRKKRILAAARRLEVSGTSAILQKIALADQVMKGRNLEPAVGTTWDHCERIILGFCHSKNYI